MQYVSNFLSRTLCIGSYTCHRRVYLLCLSFVYTIFLCIIYHGQSVRTSFSIVLVPVNFLIHKVQFQKVCYEMFLWSTSEARIEFLTITCITFIFRVTWLKGWFIIIFYLLLLLQSFLIWMWTSTVTLTWLRKNLLSHYFYWFVLIQIFIL